MCPSEYSKDDDCLVDGLNSGEEDKPQEKLALSSSSPPPEEDLLAGSDLNRSQVATGGGLSAEQLQELHKTDPKKVKRILANRSSAARSKVRKLRYIAELDSRATLLHQQVSEMSAELRTLQEDTTRLGEENEWLYSQLLGLVAQSLSMDQETETLQAHIRQSRAFSRPFPGPPALRSSALASQDPLQQTPAMLPKDSLSIPRSQFELSASAFQGHPRAPQLLPGQAFTGEPASLPDISPLYVNSRGFTPHLQHETPNFAGEQIAGRNLVSLHSYNSSEGSAMSSTTQELQLAPEDPALLSLLRNFDLGTWQTRDPGVPLVPGSLARYDRSRSVGVAMPRPKFPPYHEARFGSGTGHLGPTPSALQQLEVDGLAALPPRSSTAGLPPAAYLLSLLQDPTFEASSTAKGLARWPRHLSDPQGFYRGPYAG